jgi:hypothetical protein
MGLKMFFVTEMIGIVMLQRIDLRGVGMMGDRADNQSMVEAGGLNNKRPGYERRAFMLDHCCLNAINQFSLTTCHTPD